MNTNTLAALVACVGALGMLALVYTLGLAAAAAVRRTPAPMPSPVFAAQLAASSSTGTPSSTDAPAPHVPDPRPLDAYEIRARTLADTWRREGRLSPAGYLRLCGLMYAGADVYPYWSGGELHGTAVVWDGTRGRPGITAGERVTVEEWNADAEHDTGAQGAAELLDASGEDPAPTDDRDAHLCPTCGRPLAYHVDAGEYCASCAPASFLLQLDALDAERQHRNGGAV